MSDPFIGEIRPFAFNYTPQGWFACNGSLQSIQQYTALFAILGARYGGDGKTTFGVPDLRGRTIMSAANNGLLPPTAGALSSEDMEFGSTWGASDVVLLSYHMPAHSHTAQAYGPTVGVTQVGTADVTCYLGLVRSGSNTYDIWSSNTNPTAATDNCAVSVVGGGQSHNNNQPYLPLNFCICWDGLFMPNPN